MHAANSRGAPTLAIRVETGLSINAVEQTVVFFRGVIVGQFSIRDAECDGLFCSWRKSVAHRFGTGNGLLLFGSLRLFFVPAFKLNRPAFNRCCRVR